MKYFKSFEKFILEQSITWPVIVKNSYSDKKGHPDVVVDCDTLHAFQGTKNPKKTIGNMHGFVGDKIKELAQQGFKIKPTKVSVEVNDFEVNWKVELSESDDGLHWAGFTSRGAGCNNDIETRWNSKDVGQDMDSIKANIEEVYKPKKVNKIELINTFTHKDGDNSFKQGFYRYCFVEDNGQQQQQPVEIPNSGKISFSNQSDFVRLGEEYVKLEIGKTYEMILKDKGSQNVQYPINQVYSITIKGENSDGYSVSIKDKNGEDCEGVYMNVHTKEEYENSGFVLHHLKYGNFAEKKNER